MNYFGLKLLGVTIILTVIVAFGTQIMTDDEKIIGTWTDEKDSLSKWVFTPDKKCKRYYENELLFTFNYSISNISPQCGRNVPIDVYTNYLNLKNIADNNENCYEINGFAEVIQGRMTLSITKVDGGGYILLVKQ